MNGIIFVVVIVVVVVFGSYNIYLYMWSICCGGCLVMSRNNSVGCDVPVGEVLFIKYDCRVLP